MPKRPLLLLIPLALMVGCINHRTPQGLSDAEVARTLSATCQEQSPKASPEELRRCMEDAAHTYARGLETFEQSYPLAPVRVLCGTSPHPETGITISCK